MSEGCIRFLCGGKHERKQGSKPPIGVLIYSAALLAVIFYVREVFIELYLC